MQDCRYRGMTWLALAMSGALLAGCGALKPTAPVAAAAPAEPVPVVDDKIVQAHAHYIQGMMYELDDESVLAEEELSKAAVDDPGNSELVLELSRRFLQQKQPEKALDFLTRATALPDAPGVLFARLGMVYSQLGRDEPAVQACQTAIQRAPDLMEGYRTLFLIHLAKGRPKEALKVLNQAVKAANTSPTFGLELAELYVALARQAPSEQSVIHTNALTALKEAADQNLVNPHLRLRLADDYNELGDTTNAVKIYLDLLNTYRDLPAFRTDLHNKLARLYIRLNDHAGAAAQLKGILEDDPSNAEANYLLGALADEDKQPEQAEEYYGKAVVMNETFLQGYYDLARVQIDLDKPKNALATLDKAHARFGSAFMGEVLTALAFERQKDYTNAVAHFTAAEVIAKATDPAVLKSSFYFDEGAAFERASNFDQAEQCFQKSIELAPDSAEALNYLGYMWADRSVKLDQALDLIGKAVKLEPKSPAYLDSLGWVLYKLNRPLEALPQIQKAIELSPEADATLYEHLGDIYAALKQTDKARDAWTKSLSVEPNEAIRQKLRAAGGQPAP